jgi:NADP-reducing hydrogenase subunit HndA
MKEKNCCCESVQDSSCAIIDERELVLEEIIKEHKDVKGALVPILHKVQELYGYIPTSAQEKISSDLNIPLSEIYGVISFYHNFSTKPKGKYTISVCMGTACYVKGAGDILQRFKDKLNVEEGGSTEDGLFTVEACRCLGACGLAPVLTVGDKVYGQLTLNDVDKIIEEYRRRSINGEA